MVLPVCGASSLVYQVAQRPVGNLDALVTPSLGWMEARLGLFGRLLEELAVAL